MRHALNPMLRRPLARWILTAGTLWMHRAGRPLVPPDRRAGGGSASRPAIVLLAAAVLVAGCASHVRQTRETTSPIEPGESIAVAVSLAASPGTDAEAGRRMADCVGTAIRAHMPAVRLVPAEEFHRAAVAYTSHGARKWT